MESNGGNKMTRFQMSNKRYKIMVEERVKEKEYFEDHVNLLFKTHNSIKNVEHFNLCNVRNSIEDYYISLGILSKYIDKDENGNYYQYVIKTTSREATEDEANGLFATMLNPIFRSSYGDGIAKKFKENENIFTIVEME